MAAQQALAFLIDAVFSLLIALHWARFVVEWSRVGFRDPIAQGILSFTNPQLTPLRGIIPSWRGIGMAAPLMALALSALKILLIGLIYGLPGPGAFAILTLASWIDALLMLLLIMLLVYVILSFFDRFGEQPISAFLSRILAPLLGPIRQRMPPLGPLDLSVFVLSILLIFIRILVVGSLEELAQYSVP